MLREAEDLAHNAPDPVARHCVADAAGCDRQAEPRISLRVCTSDDLEE
jgi:hypothetical protein